MHILPVLAGLEVLVLGGGPDIFFFVHLNCASNERSCRAGEVQGGLDLEQWMSRRGLEDEQKVDG